MPFIFNRVWSLILIRFYSHLAGINTVDFRTPWRCTSVRTHHVLHVDERVVDGHDLDALLEACPQDKTTDATEATGTHRARASQRSHTSVWSHQANLFSISSTVIYKSLEPPLRVRVYPILYPIVLPCISIVFLGCSQLLANHHSHHCCSCVK